MIAASCARAQNHWHYGEADVVRLAAAMMIGIAQNHAFEQGNKRTAITAAIMFIEINGYQWVMPNNEVLGLMVEATLLGRISEEKFAELVRPFVMPTND